MSQTTGLLIAALVASTILTQPVEAQLQTAAAQGWHPWYEVHADPEEPRNILICGARWDFGRNALSGFVYRSADGGHTWGLVLEDKHSDWVSEESCAIGSHHTAYFLSEASLVRDGKPNHHLGTSRLFVSTDGGEHWTDTLKMGWADWSSSAVNSSSGELVTFYHHSTDSGSQEKYGSTVGVLTFDPDGKHVRGPFLNAEMRARNYRGVYPFAAVSLNDGTAGALYYGRRQTPSGGAYDLGFIRFSRPGYERTTAVPIAQSEQNPGCFSALGDSDLTYDRRTDTLAVAFLGLVEKNCAVILAQSADHGASWKSRVLMSGDLTGEGFLRPSLAYSSTGDLAVLWVTRKGVWRLVRYRGGHLVSKPLELWNEENASRPTQDSLWTVIDTPAPIEPNKNRSASVIDITVRSLAGRIWRSKGLVAVGDEFYAVGLGIGEQSQKLYTAVVGGIPDNDTMYRKLTEDGDETDVTKQVRIVFGGSQSLDAATGILEIDLRIVNRGETPIWTPIQLIADEISSRNGEVIVVNSDNGKPGVGAAWDLSTSITGNEIPPGASTYNAFRLLFRLNPSNSSLRTDHLLNLKARVRARVKPQEPISEQ